jgi:hypothetical protein
MIKNSAIVLFRSFFSRSVSVAPSKFSFKSRFKKTVIIIMNLAEIIKIITTLTAVTTIIIIIITTTTTTMIIIITIMIITEYAETRCEIINYLNYY